MVFHLGGSACGFGPAGGRGNSRFGVHSKEQLDVEIEWDSNKRRSFQKIERKLYFVNRARRWRWNLLSQQRKAMGERILHMESRKEFGARTTEHKYEKLSGKLSSQDLEPSDFTLVNSRKIVETTS